MKRRGGGTAAGSHKVTVNAGEHGKVSTDGTNWSDSVEVNVIDNGTLGNAVQYKADEGYKAGSVTAPIVIKKVVASATNTAAIDVDGDLYTAGDNGFCQLGRNLEPNKDSDYVLTKVDMRAKITDVAAGENYIVILDENGDVWTAGGNYYGQLGRTEYAGNITNSWRGLELEKIAVGDDSVKIKAVAAGQFHTILIDENGGVWTAGNNQYGQLGRATNIGSQKANADFEQASVNGNVKIVAADAGRDHTVLLDENGDVWTAGYNFFGQLGRGDFSTNANSTFEKVTAGISDVKMIAVSAGYAHTAILDQNGEVWTTGYNFYGELGRTTNNNVKVNSFEKANLQDAASAKFISAGNSNTIVIDADGNARTCGISGKGQLGRDTMESANPDLLAVTEGISGKKMVAAASGSYYSFLLDENGGIWSCGTNLYGQLCREENFGTSTGAYTFAAVTEGMSQNITFAEMQDTVIRSNRVFTILAEEKEKAQVNYDLDGGEWVEGFTPKNVICEGEALSLPDASKLKKTGYTFSGWKYGDKLVDADTGYDDLVEDDTVKEITLTAQWTVNQYTITFDTTGGSQIDSITQNYGSDITVPADPTREGYEFVGWDKAIPETMPAENLTITANWKDITEPTGEISIGEKKWTELLNNITFDLFFKDTQEVTIKAEDNSGEAVKIAYLLSNKSLTSEELAESTFTEYSEPFAINLDNEYIIYAKLTDAANNTKYICSNGIVLDKTAPVIAGVENGKTYCSAQTVTITEKYIDSVTVNQQDVQLDGNTFTLKPSDDMQEIVVTDKAGNTSAKMIVKINNGHTFVNNECSVCGYKRPAGGGSLVQKPEIITGEGGKTSLENNGTTLVITPDEGMELSKVTVNGKEVTVTDNKLTGLKTGDKVEVIFAKIPPTKEEIDNIFKGKALKLELIVRTSKTPKKNIKAVVKETAELNDLIKEIKDAGYTVKYKFYRSVKKSSKYEARLTKTEGRYINTIGKKGTKYYYKAKLLIYDTEGNLVAQTELKQCKYGLRTWSK